MRRADIPLAKELQAKLVEFRKSRALPGISTKNNFGCLIEQMVDSIRRIKYVRLIRDKNISPLCADARSIAFDPIKAAAWRRQQGNVNEACWLVFLATQFGKHVESKWGLVKSIYGARTYPAHWNWDRISANPNLFRQWLRANRAAVQATGNFGNHRSRETLDDSCTGATVAGYVSWVGTTHNHQTLVNNAQNNVGANPGDMFRYLYNNMSVPRFGRLGKFDYLSMLGKLNLMPIAPSSTYLRNATGPLRGARLLFKNNKNANVDEDTACAWLDELGEHLDLDFGMQVLEDAVCNWQKNPSKYTRFAG